MSADEFSLIVEQLGRVHDIVRVVDPIRLKVLAYQEGAVVDAGESACCYAFFNKGKRCENCISSRVFLQRNRQSKFEFADTDVYYVIAQQVQVDGRLCVLELADKTTEEVLEGAFEESDQLTGALSKKGFLSFAEQIFKRSDEDRSYAIIAVDVKNFKVINEIFGLQAGDNLLKSVYETLSSGHLHAIAICRTEADRFICLVDKERIDLDELESLLQVMWMYNLRNVSVSLNAGVAFVTDSTLPVQQWIEWATIAKQVAKESHFHNVVVFNNDMRQDYISRAQVLSDFHRGISEDEFRVCYQPIMDLTRGKAVSAEALVRWQHKDLGYIKPNHFIPVLEDNGLITELDHYVLREVYRFLERAEGLQLPLSSVGVNLSWQDFFDSHMTDDVINLAATFPLKQMHVNLEVTESSLVALNKDCSYLMGQFQECGSKILLDDFGSGVSSLGMISGYSFDVVKLDRSFIMQIESSQKTRAIIQAVIVMCHDIGIQVLGEGVETKEQLDFLMAAGCDYAQGFYFARPMTEEDFCRYLMEHGDSLLDDECVEDADAGNEPPILDIDFFKSVVDDVDQIVAVVDPVDYSVIYQNKKSLSISLHGEEPCNGRTCYEYFCGFEHPCDHCVMKSVAAGEKRPIAIGNGDDYIIVQAYMQDVNGKLVFVEREEQGHGKESASENYILQCKGILQGMSNLRWITHLDLTADCCIGFSGNSENFRVVETNEGIDSYMRQISKFIVNGEDRKGFVEMFQREVLIDSFYDKRYQTSVQVPALRGNGEVFLPCVTAYVLMNDTTGHLECLLYATDTSTEGEDVSELRSAVSRISSLYEQADLDRRVDFLTGLGNRLDLNDKILQLEEGSQEPVAVIMLDIDDFKLINDRYGHQVGDCCLREIGSRLGAYGRENGISFFRYGGDEILGIVENEGLDVGEAAKSLLEIGRGISLATEDGAAVKVTVSVGYVKQHDAPQKMIGFADQALYRAKGKGKDCIFESRAL